MVAACDGLDRGRLDRACASCAQNLELQSDIRAGK
jgi:hypothetical protein